MKLSIIIPYFDKNGTIKETFKKRILQVLEKQTFKDFEVIIVNDMPPFPITIEDVKDYNLDIKIIFNDKNYGVGLSRERGKLNASGEYITFIDNDDTFATKNALEDVVKSFEDNDIIVSNFIEQTVEKDSENKNICYTHCKDRTWMHGKFYKREFLEKNEIHFHPQLRYSEDTYFNNICFALTDKVKDVNIITYFWLCNENSITRNNKQEYNTKYYCDYIKAARASLNNLMRRTTNNNELYGKVIISALQAICYAYYYMQLPFWKNRKDDYKLAINEFVDLYKQYQGIFDLITDINFAYYMNEARMKVFETMPFIEKETFKQFIKVLGLKAYKIFR